MTVVPAPTRVRSVLFAPAVRRDVIAKLGRRGADLVVIDCEDATPVSMKEEGRVAARELGPVVARDARVAVRVNPVDSDWFADDVASLPEGLAAVVVPKVETIDGLNRVASALAAGGRADLGVFAGLETALGVADARQLLAHPQVVAGYFGAEDFIADMGGVRTASNAEVVYARGGVALAGRLAGVPVIDQVVTEIRTQDRFLAEAAEARAMGFVGKLCIHPGQVVAAHEAFTPSDEEVATARRLLAAYEAGIASGTAAIDFEGRMVDEPLAVQARRIIEQADGA